MTLPASFEITLEFLSDWHIGTGQGRLGTVDAEVRRDSDRLPFVPAKSLVGVWRDACETVATTFDRAAGGSTAWQAWVTWLFGTHRPVGDSSDPTGTPTPAALRLTPARAPEWLRRGVRGSVALAQAAVVLRPGVTIDDRTGTAADRLLRVEERAIRGMRLHSRVSVALADPTDPVQPLPQPAELLLRAGARMVEAFGGKRNRGSGRVAFLLPDVQLDTRDSHPTVVDPRLVELLAGGVPTAPPPPPPSGERIEVHPYEGRHERQRRVVRVVLRVLSPVVAAETVLGNVITSRDSIPGTALLGTILRQVESGDGSGRIGLAELRVGDAVPAVSDPNGSGSALPASPVPAVWQRGDKGRGNTVYNTLVGTANRDDRAKRMSGWIVPDGSRWQLANPAMTASTHAIVDDQARRPTVASGGVYTYVGIREGTLLCTDVVLPARARLRLRRGEQLRFGRSRKDDFGLVEVVDVVDVAPRRTPPAADSNQLRVWCVSDVLLRDERLAPDPSPQALARALSAALGQKVTVVGQPATSVTRRDGFAVAWGRPRSSQVALRAGGVVCFTVSEPVDPARLAELERDGIGERTAEGYGRIRFNPPELTAAQPEVTFDRRSDPTPPEPTPASPSREPVDPSREPVDPSREPAHPIELNAWRRAIRRASAGLTPRKLFAKENAAAELTRAVDRLAGRRAQLGSLRAQLELLPLPGGTEMVRTWIEGTRAVRARREAWSEPLLDSLADLLLNDQNLIWQKLGLDGDRPDLVLAPGREDTVRQQLHTEALLTAVTDALRILIQTKPRPADRPDQHAEQRTPQEAR